MSLTTASPGTDMFGLFRAAVLLMCLQPCTAIAQEGNDVEAERDVAVEFEEMTHDPVYLSSTLKLETAMGTASRQAQKVEAVLEPKIEIDFAANLQLTAIGRARADALDRLEPGQPSLSQMSGISRRVFIGNHVDLELRELHVESSLDRTLITVGKQQIVWGQADGLKVLDVVNPQEFREFILEPFSDSRIPLWALNIEQPIGDVTVQAVWVVDQTVHVLPEPGALFAFTSPRLAPLGPGVTVRSVDRPSGVIADSDAGLRAAAVWQGWDVTLNYLYRYDDFPVFERELPFAGPEPAIVLTPEYRRHHLLGGTLSQAFGPLTVRSELAGFLDRSFSTSDPTDSNGIVDSDEFNYVIGLDWFGIDETLVSFQIFQSVIADGSLDLPRDRVETTVTFLVRHEMLNDTLVLEMLWLHGVDRGDGILRPKITYALDDRTSIWLGADWFYGGGGGLFGQFNANDRIVLGIEWTF